MRAAVLHGPGDVRADEVPDTVLKEPTDAVVRITHACICGSDLWIYRGVERVAPGARLGHEWMGVVEDVGSEVTTLKRGDRVVAPFAFADGTCDQCVEGLYTSCEHVGYWGFGNDGGQAEAVRSPFADATLVRLPDAVGHDEALLKRILPLTDVMATGHHAAVSAGVGPGSTACVIGDGAVGVCATIAARRLGAERVIVVGHRPARLELARTLGATDVVNLDDDAAVEEVRELTAGGARHVLECVGAANSMTSALRIARDGGQIGFVGWAHGVTIDVGRQLYGRNLTVKGGVCPARAYIPELLDDVLAGTLDPSPVLDMHLPLAEVGKGYAAMDSREALKVMLTP